MKQNKRDILLIYRDFFVFSAVAWFAAGVITPLTSPAAGIFGWRSVLTLIATLILLRFAIIVVNFQKKYDSR